MKKSTSPAKMANIPASLRSIMVFYGNLAYARTSATTVAATTPTSAMTALMMKCSRSFAASARCCKNSTRVSKMAMRSSSLQSGTKSPARPVLSGCDGRSLNGRRVAPLALWTARYTVLVDELTLLGVPTMAATWLAPRLGEFGLVFDGKFSSARAFLHGYPSVCTVELDVRPIVALIFLAIRNSTGGLGGGKLGPAFYASVVPLTTINFGAGDGVSKFTVEHACFADREPK